MGIIFMGMEFFCVGHMFESLLNEFMEMRYFWVDWDIVWMSWNLNVWNGIWGLVNFLERHYFIVWDFGVSILE